MQRVVDLTDPPVVGRFYRVVAIRVLSRRFYGASGWRWCGPDVWLPIMGALHRDPEIGQSATDPHWHADPRFIGRRLWEMLGLPAGPVRFNDAKYGSMSAEQAAMGRIFGPERVTAGPEERRFRCVRAMPPFAVGGPGAPVAKLEPLYRRVRLPAGCQVCPHRGFPLASLPCVAGRYVVCAGHGLSFDLKTGRMVPRKRLEEIQGR